MRLIDLDELKKFPIRVDTYDKENGNENFVMGIEAVLEYAENLPTIDKEPAQHGKWRKLYVTWYGEHRATSYACDQCGHDRQFFGTHRAAYCEDCGAIMGGVVDNV